MASDEHLSLLLEGTVVWNEWYRCNPDITPDLSRANLSGANLSEAKLSEANLNGAAFYETILGNVDLRQTIGLDTCKHFGPSTIDFRTLSLSGNLPIPFLRGCGLPESLIEYLPSLRGEALQFYSCFISYSSKDQMFADRLYADLQNAGVRCWFAPHDLPIGAKTWDAIDEAIRLRDKLLVILSKASIGSDWVEDEVNKAYAEERDRKTTVLFPVRIDNVVMTTQEPWARKLRDQRNIGDFRQWRSVARYSKSLERLLRNLKSKHPAEAAD
jgi:TIR domain/Pentapeptide repeats (8 copies)